MGVRRPPGDARGPGPRGHVPRPAPPVQVSINSFELVGFPPAHRFGVTAAFERELRRLLQVRGLPSALPPGGAHEREAAPDTIRVDPAGSAAVAGRAIARVVYGRLR
jgi:hypothetical protein